MVPFSSLPSALNNAHNHGPSDQFLSQLYENLTSDVSEVRHNTATILALHGLNRQNSRRQPTTEPSQEYTDQPTTEDITEDSTEGTTEYTFQPNSIRNTTQNLLESFSAVFAKDITEASTEPTDDGTMAHHGNHASNSYDDYSDSDMITFGDLTINDGVRAPQSSIITPGE